MPAETVPDRVLWRLSGPDSLSFLQGLVSNDVLPLGKAPGMVWAALLTPQGKYLADFFVIRRASDPENSYLIDIAADLAPATLRRLMMYKLRARMEIHETALHALRGLGPAPEGALPDPRHPALGWRFWSESTGAAPDPDPSAPDRIDWEAIRVEHLIPEHPNELRVDESYILEAGFERLNGVNFRKGCYVGQEITARMKHKTELRKGLVRLRIEGEAAPGTAITLEDGREAGRLGTRSGNRALAHMRFDRLAGPLVAGTARLFAED